MPENTQTRQPQRGLTFDDVWAALMELRDSQAEAKAEHDRMIAEAAAQAKKSKAEYDEQQKKSKAEYDQRQKEYDEQQKKSKAEYDERQKKLDARMDKLDDQLGGLHRSVGDLIETLMAGRHWEKFPKYNFSRMFQRIKILNDKKVVITEIDILLSDDEWAMAVEVKREPDKDDVKHHLKRMKLMRDYNLKEISGKKLLGAIAGGVVSPDVREYAQQSGFFVLELNGEQVSLLESPEGFTAFQG
jgi:hypothetical protein